MKPLPPELEAKIDEIRSWMFRPGSQREVAKRARMDYGNVSRIMNKSRYPTEKFMKAAIEVMNENKARFEISTMKVA